MSERSLTAHKLVLGTALCGQVLHTDSVKHRQQLTRAPAGFLIQGGELPVLVLGLCSHPPHCIPLAVLGSGCAGACADHNDLLPTLSSKVLVSQLCLQRPSRATRQEWT